LIITAAKKRKERRKIYQKMSRILSSDEVNFLIFRYLQESGFRHSAFTFGHESQILKSSITSSDLPAGALISFIQKGIQYLQIETKLTGGENDVNPAATTLNVDDNLGSFELLNAHLKQKFSSKITGKSLNESHSATTINSTGAMLSSSSSVSGINNNNNNNQNNNNQNNNNQNNNQNNNSSNNNNGNFNNNIAGPFSSVTVSSSTLQEQVDDAAEILAMKITEDKVTVLRGHQHEVFVCSWNPRNPLQLASGSGDGTARLWNLPQGFPCGKEATLLASKTSIVLHHSKKTTSSLLSNAASTEQQQQSQMDVTTLDWSGDGKLLATGSYDGSAKVWTEDGQLLATFDKHRGPIFSLRWNRRGDLLLSGSVDRTAIVWDLKTQQMLQQFELHKAPTLDVDWRPDDSTFATCSTDRSIFVCRVGEAKPLRLFQEHTDEVNAVRWDPSGSLLASCSDDGTCKIWGLKSESSIFTLADHRKEIYTLKWSPTGKGSRNPQKPLLLATASFDNTVRLWDPQEGRCLFTLAKHTEPVYAIAFHPSGEFLASGSFDRSLIVWSLKDGSPVKTYSGSGSIFELGWNCTGDKVAACFSNSITEDFSVSVFDIKLP